MLTLEIPESLRLKYERHEATKPHLNLYLKVAERVNRLYDHEVVRNNGYCKWFKLGNANTPQIIDLIEQWFVFSRHFPWIQAKRMSNSDTWENEKDSFGPLLQCFTRELFDNEWFFIELVQRDYNPDEINIKLGEQFANQTVRSLYVTKQEEFRDWLSTRKKRLMFDGNPAKMKWFRDLLLSVEPYGYVKIIPSLRWIFEQVARG